MNLPGPSVFIALALLVLPLHAAVLEDFSGYSAGETFTTGQTSGTATAGWTGGWRTASSHVTTTGVVENVKPLDAGQYLDVTVFAVAGHPTATGGAVSRPYTVPTTPFTLSFRFRPGNDPKTLRYSLFDNDTRAAGPGNTATWQIVSHDGRWRLLDGAANGLPEAVVDTDMPVVAGTTYTFTLAVNPALRTWDAMISDGTRTVAHKGLGFRTGNVTPERWIHFAANELSVPASGITITYSIDTLSLHP